MIGVSQGMPSAIPITPGDGNLFLPLINARYEKGAMILTSNRGFAEWGEVFGDPSSQPRCSTGCFTTPSSFRSKVSATGCAGLIPENFCSIHTINPPPAPKRRGCLPKAGADQQHG